MKRLAVFASGAGTNAAKIIDYFNDPVSPSTTARVSLIVCNNPAAGVLNIAKENSIPVLLIEKERFIKGDGFLPELQQAEIDFVILAGFLWKVPPVLIRAFANRMINIHPALLPKFGGKGMYGKYVHQAVIDQQEKETGITIHLVDEIYDHGKIIFQAKCPVYSDDTASSVAIRVAALEHKHYPEEVHRLISGNKLL